jgi:hypothetical protein
MDLSTFIVWNCPLSILGASRQIFVVDHTICRAWSNFKPHPALYWWQRIIIFGSTRLGVKSFKKYKK